MLILPNIELIETTDLQYQDAKVGWSFGGNSSVIYLYNNIDGVICSEHWITDLSDVFSFDKNHNLSSMEVSVPNENKKNIVNVNEVIFGEIFLGGDNYVIEQSNTRFFDHVERRLWCFNHNVNNDSHVTSVKLHNDFSLILSEGKYSGYVLNNPISYLTDKVNGVVDFDGSSNEEYKLMSDFLYIMSDNRLGELDDDMESLVRELYNKIIPNAHVIKSNHRYNIIKSSVEELLDFYA